MVGGRKAPGRSTLAGIGGLIGLLALALVPSASAAEQPLSRYSIVHGCYSLATGSGGTVAKQGGAYAIGSGNAEAFRMQATDLGRYLFYGRDARLPRARRRRRSPPAAQPSDDADWTVSESGAGFTIVNEYAGKALAIARAARWSRSRPERPSASSSSRRSGCPALPGGRASARRGGPATGSPAYGEVGGLVDGHMHGMAYEFLGGKAHCGQPVAPLRRPLRAARLPRPRGRRRLRGGARERPLRQPGALSRPGRLADLQGLARTTSRSPTSSPTGAGSSGPGAAACAST